MMAIFNMDAHKKDKAPFFHSMGIHLTTVQETIRDQQGKKVLKTAHLQLMVFPGLKWVAEEQGFLFFHGQGEASLAP